MVNINNYALYILTNITHAKPFVLILYDWVYDSWEFEWYTFVCVCVTFTHKQLRYSTQHVCTHRIRLRILPLYYRSDRVGEQSVDQKRESAAAAIVVSSPYASTASWASIRARQPLLLSKKVLRVSLEGKKKTSRWRRGTGVRSVRIDG